MTFLAPAFFFGLLAIAAPLWLHRMAKSNPTRQPFASLMFLEASETQRAARHTLRYWLLLALRIAFLVALVIAFAGPLAPPRMLGSAERAAPLHAIVLDASFSMQGEPWRRATAAADSVIDGLAGQERVMLARAAGQRIEIVHEPARAADAGSVRATLRSLTPSLGRLDFGVAMSAARSWLRSQPGEVVLHFISDMQQTGAPLRFADLEPPADARLVIHPVTSAALTNAYIENVAFAGPQRRVLQVSVRHAGAAAQQRELVLSVDGQEHSRQTIELPPAPVPNSLAAALTRGEGGGAAAGPDEAVRPASAPGAARMIASFGDLQLSPGAHRLEVTMTPADDLPLDDRYVAVIERADPRAMLIARSERADEAAYFAAALESLEAPRLLVEQRNASGLAGDAMSDYSLVVVADVSALSERAAEQLLEFTRGGGAVLATLGSGSDHPPSALLEDWRFGAVRTHAAAVGDIATAHPVLRDAGEWRRVRFFKQRLVTVAEADRVLLSYEDGAPLLIERTLGAGRMLILAAPIERAWNDLAIHPLFVQFLAEAGRYLTGGDATPRSYTAGAVVLTGLTPATGGQIFDPQGRRVLGLAQANSADRLIPDQTGFYEIRSGGGARWLAVNVDSRESDLAPLPANYVDRWQALRAPERPEAAAPAPQAQAEAPGRSLGPWLMWLAAALLLAELLAANHRLAVRRE